MTEDIAAVSAISPTTRTRILEACLRLFNRSGPMAVTTAEISRVVGINEGNLYYYFKKKEDIVTALFEQFEAALDAVADATPLPGDDGFGVGYLRRWFELMWEWRFFYRDSAAIKRMAPKMRRRSVALADKGQRDIRRVLGKMAEQGLLSASPVQLDKLMVNAWIVSSYWLDYLHSRHNIDDVTREHLDWGFSQVLELFMPYAAGKLDGASTRAPA